MDYEIIKNELGVCGLDCSRCVSRKEGDVSRLSVELQSALTNFERMVPAFSAFVPALENYGQFKEVLEFLASGKCEGCRSGTCLTQGCAAKECHKEQKVDFCYECPEYPCSRNEFPPALEAKWRNNNDAMKANGIEAFYKASKQGPRY